MVARRASTAYIKCLKDRGNFALVKDYRSLGLPSNRKRVRRRCHSQLKISEEEIREALEIMRQSTTHNRDRGFFQQYKGMFRLVTWFIQAHVTNRFLPYYAVTASKAGDPSVSRFVLVLHRIPGTGILKHWLMRKSRQIVPWGLKGVNRFIKIIILIILAERCGGVLTNPAGEITSPNYPNNYPDDVSCTWKISPEKTHVNLTVEDFMVRPRVIKRSLLLLSAVSAVSHRASISKSIYLLCFST